MLSFQAFPLDNSYNVAQTMSVYFGNVALVNGVTFAVSTSSVPYTPFVFPVTVAAAWVLSDCPVFASEARDSVLPVRVGHAVTQGPADTGTSHTLCQAQGQPERTFSPCVTGSARRPAASSKL